MGDPERSIWEAMRQKLQSMAHIYANSWFGSGPGAPANASDLNWCRQAQVGNVTYQVAHQAQVFELGKAAGLFAPQLHGPDGYTMRLSMQAARRSDTILHIWHEM